MSVSGTPVTTYYDGFPKAHPSLPPSTRRSGRGVVHRRTLVELTNDHESLATRVVDPTLSTAERAGGVGGALGNPSSYVGKGVPATDRRAVGQTVRSGFPRPHPPHPPGGSAAIGSPQFRTETLRNSGDCAIPTGEHAILARALNRAHSPACDVWPARSSRELREFRELPRVLRGADPHWVEPLRTEQTRLLDRDRHPFYVDGEGATAEFFLARDRRTGRAVGRVAAILNERYNRHRRESGAAPLQGFFGFFDSIDSLDVTGGLLESAARWLRERGAAEMIGPASPSQNYEYGILIEGHERP